MRILSDTIGDVAVGIRKNPPTEIDVAKFAHRLYVYRNLVVLGRGDNDENIDDEKKQRLPSAEGEILSSIFQVVFGRCTYLFVFCFVRLIAPHLPSLQFAGVLLYSKELEHKSPSPIVVCSYRLFCLSHVRTQRRPRSRLRSEERAQDRLQRPPPPSRHSKGRAYT